MAVDEAHQGRRGRRQAPRPRGGRPGGRRRVSPPILVATAAADVGNLRFYQRQGFRFRSIERDALTAATGYPEGLLIDGIELRDASGWTAPAAANGVRPTARAVARTADLTDRAVEQQQRGRRPATSMSSASCSTGRPARTPVRALTLITMRPVAALPAGLCPGRAPTVNRWMCRRTGGRDIPLLRPRSSSPAPPGAGRRPVGGVRRCPQRDRSLPRGAGAAACGPSRRGQQPLAGTHPRRRPVTPPLSPDRTTPASGPCRWMLPRPHPVRRGRPARAQRPRPEPDRLRRLLRPRLPPRPRGRRVLGG